MKLTSLFLTEIPSDKSTGEEKTAKVRMGDLYTAPQQKLMRLKQEGYKIMEMWEHIWVRSCKKHHLNPKEMF